MDVEAFATEVRDWFVTATHPVLHRPYLSCGFVPMVELLRYLEANRFTTYIASGGDRDFMRRGGGEPVRPTPPGRGGNSNGDIEMLRFARSPQRVGLRLLVRHDDADREGAAYDEGAEDALARAAERDWTVISMRNDWTRVFPDASARRG